MYKILLLSIVLLISESAGLLTAQEMEPLKISYPKPLFIGTPMDLEVERLEKTWEIPFPLFLIPEGTVNVARDKFVECSDEDLVLGEPDLITDGDKEAVDGSFIEMHNGPQYITIDLEESCTIYTIALWHYHKKARVYFDVVVQVAEDPDFIVNVTTLYNNDHDNSLGLGVGEDLHYIETYEGRLIDARGVESQFVRLYTNGNTDNELNHYIEVEVYGIPVN